MYGIADLLSHPAPGPNQLCQCWSLTAKKTALVFVFFLLVVAASVLEFLLVQRFDMPIHWIIEAGLFIAEIAALLMIVYGIFPEKTALLYPFIVVQVIRIVSYLVCIVYYIVRIVQNKSSNEGGDVGRSIVLPGVPSPGLGDMSGPQRGYTNAFFGKVIGHLLLEAALRLFFIYTVYVICRVFRHRYGQTSKYRPNLSSNSPPHNVLVLEQNVDEAIFGHGAASGQQKERI